MTFDGSNAKVGIGTTSPSNPLSVSGVITSGNFTAVGIGGTPADANTAEIGPGYINLSRDDTAAAKQITFGKNGAVHSFLETTADGLNIGGANVGINENDPDFKLHITSSTDLLCLEGNGAGGPQLRFLDTSTSADTHNFGYIDFAAYNEGGTTSGILNRIANTINIAENGAEETSFNFQVTSGVSGTHALDTSGFVIRGQAATGAFVGIGTSNPSNKLHVQGDPGDNGTLVAFKNSHDGSDTVDDQDTILLLSFSSTGSATGGHFIQFADQDSPEMGAIIADSGTASAAAHSDYRSKENILLMTSGLSEINSLKPSKFNFKDSSKVHNGFIAHEVQEVIPGAVFGTKDAVYNNGDIKPQMLSMEKLIPFMVKAIQELSAKVTALEGEDSSSDTKIAALEAEDVANKAKVTTLENENTANKTKITALETKDTASEAKIKTLEDENTANKTKITALETKDAEYATTITALTNRITALENA